MATPTNLPAAFVAGDVLEASQLNDLRGAFRILQVVSATTSTAVSNSTVTFADTGLTATITPTSTSSKVLVLVSQAGLEKSSGNAGNRLIIKLLRGATDIITFAADVCFTNSATQLAIPSASTMYLDSPATTSATTYKTQFKNAENAAAVTVQFNNTNESTITLMEISA
jgi:hypothetical protein